MAKAVSAPASFAKRSLHAHSWLGLLISAVMFLICLSGTVAVLHLEFERWEQPFIAESTEFNIDQVEKAYTAFTDEYHDETHHYYFVFPGTGVPRLVMEDDHRAHFVDDRGALIEQENVTWTEMLVDLHLYLHLPHTFGMIFVSACGALLCALIISGLFAHPRIIKDAFKFRYGGDGLKTNIDLHNRLSVWGTPFHLMIAITGAYFGLAGVFVTIIAQAFYGGDTQEVYDRAFTPEPELVQEVAPPNIGAAMRDLRTKVDTDNLLFFTVHEPGTPKQFMEFFVRTPERLIYSENYRYDSAGNYLEKAGYSDGDGGMQALYSVFRLHFGDFIGMPGKVLYVILGMMLTVISATGLNIWLKKRKTRDAINVMWPAFVWGTPIALVVSAIAYFAIALAPVWVFWLSLLLLVGAGSKFAHEDNVVSMFKQLLGLVIVMFWVVYAVQFGSAALSVAALQINLPLLAVGAWAMWSGSGKGADLRAANQQAQAAK
ncbi:MAG: PepSY domain-containing protein [Alteromonadaceae bacterium]|nr:PepSY domain-containing protein [Alteromonadaceae bacterium]